MSMASRRAPRLMGVRPNSGCRVPAGMSSSQINVAATARLPLNTKTPRQLNCSITGAITSGAAAAPSADRAM